MTTTFSELGLGTLLLTALAKAGFETPTPIQAQAIPMLLEGHDLIGQAQTGTGKTAAYLLPILERIEKGSVQALILVPTRELAQQVAEQCKALSTDIRAVAVYGGQPIIQQFKQLRNGAEIVVGTPGRLLDHLRRATLKLGTLRFSVIDEADEMLNYGFMEEVDEILAALPEEKQMALFSATLPPRIENLINRVMPKAKRVAIHATQRTVDNVEQSHCVVMPAQKTEALGRLLDLENPGPTIVFCRTRANTQDLTGSLRERGYPAESLHGDMAQSERDRVMDRFRNGQCQLLVATDVAARGLDVDGVTHVFNYDLPWDVEQYIHRVGRTARAGRQGSAITLVEPRERRALAQIERLVKASIKPRPIPTLQQITNGRVRRFETTLRTQIQEADNSDQIALVQKLGGQFDPAQLAAAAMQLLWQNLGFDRAQGADELTQPSLPSHNFSGGANMAWLSVSAGRRDGLQPRDVLGFVIEECGLSKKNLGSIRIAEKKTFFEVPAERAQAVLAGMKRGTLRGKRVRCEMAAPPKQGNEFAGAKQGG